MLGRYISVLSRLRMPAAILVHGRVPWRMNEAAEFLFADGAERARIAALAHAVRDDADAVSLTVSGRVCSLAPLFDARGEVEAVLAVEAPLAGLPRLLNTFQEPLRHFSRLVHALPQPVLSARPGGTIDFLSDRWYEIVGEPRTALEPAESFARALVPVQRARILTALRAGAAGGEPFDLRAQLVTVAGTRWFEITLRPLRSGARIVRWAGTIADVDAEVRSRRQLARSEAQLRSSLERERRVSTMLQRAMLPLALPAVPGLRFDFAYTTASDEVSVGGDWYDAFELDDGRVAIVIGDIAGHGLDAAIVMGSIRHIIRAVARDDPDPADVLARVNRELAHEHQALASVFYGVLDPMTLELIYGNAGHPPPYVVAGARVEALPMGGILLGSQDGIPAATQRVAIPPDGAIVMYTDGIIERTRDIARGEAELRAALARWSAGDCVARSAELQSAILADAPLHDDAAMFIVRLATPESLDVSLPASLRNATRMRKAFERFVRRHGFSEERAFEITLGVAEAINNAAEHAYAGTRGMVRLNAQATDAWLEARVSDTGEWRGVPSHPDRGRGLDIMRRVFEDVHYDLGPHGTVASLRARLPAVAAARG